MNHVEVCQNRKPINVTAITERWCSSALSWDACRGRCRDNFRLCVNRRSGRLGRVGSGGLDSAHQVV